MSISVIIPVYNAERFIRKCIDSVCNQKHVKEIIIIEDASVDNSLSICRKIAQKYSPLVNLYRHHDGNNHGASASRNMGIRLAKGEYIAFLDADDYYLADRFKRDIEVLDANPGISGVYNALGVHIYDEGEKDRIRAPLTTVKYPIPPEWLFEEMDPVGTAGYFHCDTLTVRRDIFNKVGFFDEDLEISQDTHMWFKMASMSLLIGGVIDRPVAMRGVHVGNRIKNLPKLYYYRHIMYISLLEWSASNNIAENRIKLLWESLYKVFDRSLKAENISKNMIKKNVYLYFIKYAIRHPSLIFDESFLSVVNRLNKL